MSMSEWQKYKLGEVYSFSSGLSKSSDQFGYGFDFLTFKDVFNNYFLPDKLTALVNSTEKERQTCSIKRGDVFLTRTSETDDELGMSSVALKDYPNATFNGFTKRLRPLGNVEIYPEFVAYYFRSPRFRANIVGMSSITTRASLNNSMLAELPLLLPNYEEQVRIATILKCLDDKIDLLHRENTTLEAMAETLFRQWFIEEAKEDWEEGKLGDWVVIKRGGSPRPINDYISSSGYRWLKISDVTNLNSPYIFQTKEYIKESGLQKTIYLSKGSLVLSNSATPGIPKILCVDSCIHDGWLYFPKSIFSKFYLYLLFKYIREDLVNLGNGSIFTNLKTDILKDYKVVKPDAKTLGNFDHQVHPIFDKLYSNDIQIQTLIQQRDGLLPKLMSGEVKI